MEKFEACAAAGVGEGLIVFADESFLIELVVVCIQPKLRYLIRRPPTGIRIVWRCDGAIGVPAAGKIHDTYHSAGPETGTMHGEKTAA